MKLFVVYPTCAKRLSMQCVVYNSFFLLCRKSFRRSLSPRINFITCVYCSGTHAHEEASSSFGLVEHVRRAHTLPRDDHQGCEEGMCRPAGTSINKGTLDDGYGEL